jgi:hypothetical protein
MPTSSRRVLVRHHHCVLKELYNLDMTTVLAFLRANTKEDLLTAPEAIDESEQWRILLRKLGGERRGCSTRCTRIGLELSDRVADAGTVR